MSYFNELRYMKGVWHITQYLLDNPHIRKNKHTAKKYAQEFL
jgi:hypothetical protein